VPLIEVKLVYKPYEPSVFLVVSSKGFSVGDFNLKFTKPPNWVPYCKEAAPRIIWISSKASVGVA
jgi:hypothetical protein